MKIYHLNIFNIIVLPSIPLIFFTTPMAVSYIEFPEIAATCHLASLIVGLFVIKFIGIKRDE